MVLAAPTIADLREHAASLSLRLDTEQLEALATLMAPSIELYRALDGIPDEVLAPRYPRGEARVPGPDEDRLGGWAAKIDVDGACDGPLAGRTIVLKDNICLAGAPMLNGTRAMGGYSPSSDATVVSRVLDAGGRIVGKAHCEYLCTSGGSHTNAWGPVRNPHRPSHTSGGSSSGCAVLVATGEADMAIGGDQGGSIRVPASFSGIVGMKPTHGLVPYTGMAGVDATLDHAGPMTKTVADNALLLGVIAGADGLDPRQFDRVVPDYSGSIAEGVQGLRIGLVDEGFGLPVSEREVDEAVRTAAMRLEAMGAVAGRVSVPFHAASALVWVPITAEGAVRTMLHGKGLGSLPRAFYPIDLLEQTARWGALMADLPPNAALMALLGQHMHSRHDGRFYAKAQNLQRTARAAYDMALEQFDVLVMPTTPMRAPPLPLSDAPLELQVRRATEPLTNTGIFDATGHPALSLPCAIVDGLPVGMMIVARHHKEAIIYRVASALEGVLALDLTPPKPT